MGRIAEASLEAIRQRIDIAELVREYVPDLKRAGRNHKARCPFHNEKTPSFHVNVDRQIFHCFGCQEGGDAFKFVMKMESLSFQEAVAKLAERAGIVLAPPEESLSARDREFIRIREALAYAADFYHVILAKGNEADAARKYVAKRGVSDAACQKFGLGYALNDGSSFLEAAVRKGFSPDVLSKAGLVALREGAGRYRDYFRGRLLFPIKNVKGEVAGFGARAMGDYEPKYLNSPDTLVFSKGKILYGLFEGLPQIRKSRRAILLEGYMDVIACQQFGVLEACAPLGTAVTPDHAMLLKRYVDQVVIVFDPDNAGSNAALRGAELLLEQGFGVKIATVPDGLDPDELLHRDGVSAWERCLAAAKDLPDFMTQQLIKKMPSPLAAEAKSKLADSVLQVIVKCADEVLKSEWIRRLSQQIGVAEEALMRQLRNKGAAPVRTFRKAEAPVRVEAASLPSSDAAILKALLKKPQLAQQEASVSADDFETEKARRVFSRLKEMTGPGVLVEVGSPSWTSAFLESLSPEDGAAVGGMMIDESTTDVDPGVVLAKVVEEIRLVKRYKQLHKQLFEGSSDVTPQTMHDYNTLLRQLSDRRLLNRIKTQREE